MTSPDNTIVPDHDASTRRRRSAPAGAEPMAPPWRLGVLGVGIAVGLAARLLAANGFIDTLGGSMMYTVALTALLAGIGVLALSAERDRFGRWMILLCAMTGLSLGALQWISPHFPAGTLEWSDSTQAALAMLGVGNGVLFAGILTLALVRRWPTMTVVAVLAGAVLTLTACTVLLHHDWPAIVALASAFLFVLLGWDRAPRHEPVYQPQEGSPRISRAALSLAIVALSGAGIQLWVSRGQDIGRAGPAVVVSVALLALAFLAMIALRRELQQRETTLSEWTAWMREFRTGDLRADFESLGTTELGVPVGDLTAEAPRPLSFPDLRIEEADAQPTVPLTESAEEHPTERVPPIATMSGPDAPAIEDLEIEDLEIEDLEIDPPIFQPVLFGDQPPAAMELRWADDAPEIDDLPSPATSNQAALFDFEPAESIVPDLAIVPDQPANPRPGVTADEENEDPESSPTAQPTLEPPAIIIPTSADTSATQATASPAAAERPTSSAFSTLAGDACDVSNATPSAGSGAPAPGAFSSWLDGHVPSRRSTPEDLATWIDTPPAPDDRRLVVAIETMSLGDFDMLPAQVSQAMNDAVLDSLHDLTPAPTQATVIDGPYLMAAWSSIEHDDLGHINAKISDLLAMVVATDEGAVALSGTLALLRPGPRTTFDHVIDDAIVGLAHARRLETLANTL